VLLYNLDRAALFLTASLFICSDKTRVRLVVLKTINPGNETAGSGPPGP